MSGPGRERGSASIWVLACCALLLSITFASTLRTAAVLARHRAESAADLAALAAAGQIGLSAGGCAAAVRVAAANGAIVQHCTMSLAPDRRSGTVAIRVGMRVRLPLVGGKEVVASARAEREPLPH